MKIKLTAMVILLLSFSIPSRAQAPLDSQLRVVDTLSAAQRSARIPLLLRSELDSLKEVYYPQPAEVIKKPEPVPLAIPSYLGWIGLLFALSLLAAAFLVWRSQTRSANTILELKELLARYTTARAEQEQGMQPVIKGKGGKEVDKKVQALNRHLQEAQEEIQQLEADKASTVAELEELKQQLMQVYKVRNYPGYSRERSENEILSSFLKTERSIAIYGYENFLKPLLALADENKNNPARIRKEDQEKLLELLVSLGLFYTEYLYLRVNELSIGGKMVERIGSFGKGNGFDLDLLKTLNTEHGSRALTLRIALDKMGIRHLSYPVFDETNLNHS